MGKKRKELITWRHCAFELKSHARHYFTLVTAISVGGIMSLLYFYPVLLTVWGLLQKCHYTLQLGRQMEQFNFQQG